MIRIVEAMLQSLAETRNGAASSYDRSPTDRLVKPTVAANHVTRRRRPQPAARTLKFDDTNDTIRDARLRVLATSRVFPATVGAELRRGGGTDPVLTLEAAGRRGGLFGGGLLVRFEWLPTPGKQDRRRPNDSRSVNRGLAVRGRGGQRCRSQRPSDSNPEL